MVEKAVAVKPRDYTRDGEKPSAPANLVLPKPVPVPPAPKPGSSDKK
jgi:hypothetical protein